MKILNIIASSSYEHAAVIGLHTSISSFLNSKKIRTDNIFISGEERSDIEQSLFLKFDKRSIKGKKFFWFSQQKLLTELNKHITNYDFIISDGFGVSSLLLKIQKKRDIPPTITIIHGSTKLKNKDPEIWNTPKVKKWIFSCVSEATAEYIRANNTQIPPSQIKHIYNGVDFNALETSMLSKADARETLQIDCEKFVFGTIGRLVNMKQQESIIEAAKKLKDDDRLPSDIIFTIIGDGDLAKLFKRKIKNYNLEKYFYLPGSINKAYSLIKAFDVYIMCSNAKEGFGIALLEGVSAKLPIISSDIPLFKNILKHPPSYFELGNVDSFSEKIIEFYNFDKTEQEVMGTNTYNNCRSRFDINKFHQNYLNEIINHHKTFTPSHSKP